MENIAELKAKMGEYVVMTEELPFDEFQAFYKNVLDVLKKQYESFSQDDLIAAMGICQIMNSNAAYRSKRKDANMKSFRKIAEKSLFWHDAIGMRLEKQEKMSKEDIEKAVGALWGEDGDGSAGE